MLHQKKNKAEAYYFLVFTSEYSYNRYFLKQLSTYVNRVQYTVAKGNFILTFPPGRVPCKTNLVQFLQRHKPGF